ncbi:MAG: hypothetical protein GY846_12915 [Deltaproteobacteria bacterium]|nr:hypothetical protein [Deltaproteobacteria bacterium]
MPDEDDVPFWEIVLSEGVPLITGNLKHYPVLLRSGYCILSPRQFMDDYAAKTDQSAKTD